jgi:hypothetical protein
VQDNWNILNVCAIGLSILAFIALFSGVHSDAGSLSMEPYTRPKMAASLAILLASICDIGRYRRVPLLWHLNHSLLYTFFVPE